jgi:hypothetical protein
MNQARSFVKGVKKRGCRRTNMQAKFKPNVTETDDAYVIKIDKQTMANLVDYFFFNTDQNPYFNGRGELDGIDGVGRDITAFIKSFLDITMDESDWKALALSIGILSEEEREKMIDAQVEAMK